MQRTRFSMRRICGGLRSRHAEQWRLNWREIAEMANTHTLYADEWQPTRAVQVLHLSFPVWIAFFLKVSLSNWSGELPFNSTARVQKSNRTPYWNAIRANRRKRIIRQKSHKNHTRTISDPYDYTARSLQWRIAIRLHWREPSNRHSICLHCFSTSLFLHTHAHRVFSHSDLRLCAYPNAYPAESILPFRDRQCAGFSHCWDRLRTHIVFSIGHLLWLFHAFLMHTNAPMLFNSTAMLSNAHRVLANALPLPANALAMLSNCAAHCRLAFSIGVFHRQIFTAKKRKQAKF